MDQSIPAKRHYLPLCNSVASTVRAAKCSSLRISRRLRRVSDWNRFAARNLRTGRQCVWNDLHAVAALLFKFPRRARTTLAILRLPHSIIPCLHFASSLSSSVAAMSAFRCEDFALSASSGNRDLSSWSSSACVSPLNSLPQDRPLASGKGIRSVLR